MTPVGVCPNCGAGQLRPTGDPGYVRCPKCVTTFDHLGQAYDNQGRHRNAREGT